MTLFRRKQLKDNIFLGPKTRQALTVFVLLRVFCFGHELEGRYYHNTPPFLKQQLVSVLITGMKMQILPLHP